MQLSKDFADSILQKVLEKVQATITPVDDTPDNDFGVQGMVKQAMPGGEDKNDAVENILTGALSSASDNSSDSEGTVDMISGVLNTDKQTQVENGKSGGLMANLSDIMKGSQQDQSAYTGRNPMLEMITGAIGGEGILGDLVEKVMRSKGMNVNNVVNVNEDEITDDVTKTVIDRIKDFVVDKVKDNLSGNSSSPNNLFSKFADILTPDK